jgi:hypothetical protein
MQLMLVNIPVKMHVVIVIERRLGRWSGWAFDEYLKLPRTIRRAVAKVMSRNMQ